MSNLKDDFERMMQLAEFGAKRHDEQRQVEFRVFIAYMTLLALAFYEKKTDFGFEFAVPGAAACPPPHGRATRYVRLKRKPALHQQQRAFRGITNKITVHVPPIAPRPSSMHSPQ